MRKLVPVLCLTAIAVVLYIIEPMRQQAQNPVRCDALTVTGPLDNAYSYRFKANVSVGNGASITGVEYDFGDKRAHALVRPYEGAAHRYRKSGRFAVRATIHVVDYGSITRVTSDDCKRVVVVKPKHNR